MSCTGSLEVLEGPLLRVPFESLKRAAKDRKSLLDEAQQATQEALKAAQQQAAAGADGSSASAQALTSLLSSLQATKWRMQEVSRQERDEARRCQARLQHLQQLSEPKASMVAWNAQRLDRLLADYLQRAGCYEAAKLLAKVSGSEDLVESHVFEEAKKIAAALRAHDCGPALAWCQTHRTRLRKAKSTFEFQLRVQEMTELVKRGDRLGAIHHARHHLAPWASQCLPELQRAMAVLVFARRSNAPAKYQALLSDAQWEQLVSMFFQELYRLHGLPLVAPLLAHMQAGLSALKTPASYQAGCSCQDPLSSPPFQELAQPLPFAKHTRSQLLCSVTHKVMDDDNPPVVLPNGYVYSQQAVDYIKSQNNGRMVCPQTGSSYAADELRRAYIV